MSRTQNEPTLAGWLMLVVARQLPLALSEHLMRMLGELLGAERGPDLREVRLGLVFELMWRDAAPIDADGYDEERRVRGLLGEDWPNSSTLAGHFGGWTAVQQAALDLYRVGTVARVSGRGKQAPEDRGADAYSRQEIVDAVVRFHGSTGRWPLDAEEYRAWAVVERRMRTVAYRRAKTAAEKAGQPTDGIPKARVPGLGPIYRHFRRSGFARAVDVARREHEVRSGGREPA